MNPDDLHIEIALDGSVVIEVGHISPANHVSAAQLVDAIANGLGGEKTVTRRAKGPQITDDHSQRPRLDFFRTLPSDAHVHPPLVSSVQSLESCFSLIALERYPHALISCAAAIESALKANLGIQQQDKIEFRELLDRIGAQFGNLGFPVNRGLQAFRTARNSFTHFGFSPRDDDASVALLLQVGFPYLQKCYRELFNFYLDYREVPPAGRTFDKLSESELKSVGLSAHTADQMRVALDVHRKVVEFSRRPDKHSISTFAQYLGYVIRTFHRNSDAEHPDAFYGRFDSQVSEDSMREAVQCTWHVRLEDCVKFDCSVCSGHRTLVAQCDDGARRGGAMRVRRVMCVRCGLSVPEGRPFLAEIFLREQTEAKSEILRGAV